jgi:hypothetical protein
MKGHCLPTVAAVQTPHDQAEETGSFLHAMIGSKASHSCVLNI